VRANVNELLGPVLGADNFKVSVTADVDNDKIEETQEKYGEAPKVTSEAMREEMEKSRMALGVPGTLSNRPPVSRRPPQRGAAAGAPAAAKGNDDGSARKNATTRQYAYDRAITQIKRSRGRLKKLSVAVVLNNASAANRRRPAGPRRDRQHRERSCAAAWASTPRAATCWPCPSLSFPPRRPRSSPGGRSATTWST
jgi:flagellar M-ring protein FliF